MIEVKVSKNGMTAEVLICPEPDEELTLQLVEDTLRLEGVQAGIDREAIADMLEKKIYQKYMPVAYGKEPVKGLDGYYEFFFPTDEDNGKPKIREGLSATIYFPKCFPRSAEKHYVRCAA